MISRWPFLIQFLFMTVGMYVSNLCGYYCNIITLIAVFSLLLISSFVSNSRYFAASSSLFFFCLGLSILQPWLSPKFNPQSIKNKVSDIPITIEGVITERPSVSPDGSRLVVRCEVVINENKLEPITGRLLIYVSRGDISFSRGDRIRFMTRLFVPHKLGLPGEFNYSRYLAFQGISATGRVSSQSEIVLIRGNAVPSWQRKIDQAEQKLENAISNGVKELEVSSVLSALLLGDQRKIPKNLSDAYTRAGVNHILSISGFHVGIIAAFITFMMLWLLTRFEYFALRWNVRQTALLVAIPIMISYLFLTGNAPATARSVIMLIIFAVAMFFERESDSINTLLMAAFILVAINPPTLFDVSFQLSFISLWGIILTVPSIIRYTSNIKYSILRILIQFLGVSIVASTVTILPVLFIFKVSSLNGILTNFIIVPLLGYGAVLSGFIVLPFIIIFPGWASTLLLPASTLVNISNVFILKCNSLPVFTFYGITVWDMFFFLLFMFCMTFVVSSFHRKLFALSIPLLAVIIHLYTVASAADGRLHISILSIGQAESILIKMPDGSNMLIDGGGYLQDNGQDFGQRILAPALGGMYIQDINTIVATHNHPDHSGGLPFIIKNFPVKNFWSIKDVTSEIRMELNKKLIPERRVVAGDVIKFPGSLVITVLSPNKSSLLNNTNNEKNEINENEQSLVFRLTYGKFSMIFCADAGFEAERTMLNSGAELKSTVLKVGHHGSKYSTSKEFLERVHPELAVISAGSGNHFGLPAHQTIDLLKSKKISVYRTDLDGSIDISTDGVTWSVATPFKSAR